MRRQGFFRALSWLSGVLLCVAAMPANAVPVTVTAQGAGSDRAGDPAPVTFTIEYAAGLPGDVQTLNWARFSLRTDGHDGNAFFANSPTVSLNPHGIRHTFDLSDADDGVLTVNFRNLYFDSGESFAFDVEVSHLCAGCTGAGFRPNSGGAVGFNEVLVEIDIADASVHENYMYVVNGNTSVTTVNDSEPAPEPVTLALLGMGLAGMGLMRRTRTA